jgi:hypothetical protein
MQNDQNNMESHSSWNFGLQYSSETSLMTSRDTLYVINDVCVLVRTILMISMQLLPIVLLSSSDL